VTEPGRIGLSIALGDYDINAGLISGDVAPQGVELLPIVLPSPERHWRMSRSLEFDICEFSLATFLTLHDRGTFPVVAIPAFPHRRFRHGYVFVREGSPIRQPADLNGKRIGLRTWETTAGLWMRGALQDEYGVDLASIEWLTQDEEDAPLLHADRFRISRVAEGESVVAMLERGELDALIYPDVPPGAGQPGSPIQRLFPDPKAAEMEYVRRTGFFPLMHTVVIKREVVEAHPWLPLNLLEAFRRSKDAAFARMRDPRSVSLAWLREALDEQTAALGPDPWCYEFAANRAQLETMIRWAAEQGLVAAPFPPEDLFAPSTLEESPAYV
jgi:4,5-dihydroxyphthalate decarboxylase